MISSASQIVSGPAAAKFLQNANIIQNSEKNQNTTQQPQYVQSHQQQQASIGGQQVVMMNQNGQLIPARIPANIIPTSMVPAGVTPTSRFLTPTMTYVQPGNPRRVSTSSIPSTVVSTTPPPVKKHKLDE